MKVQSLRLKDLLVKVNILTFKNLLNPGELVKVLTFLDRPTSTRQPVLCKTKKRTSEFETSFLHIIYFSTQASPRILPEPSEQTYQQAEYIQHDRGSIIVVSPWLKLKGCKKYKQNA